MRKLGVRGGEIRLGGKVCYCESTRGGRNQNAHRVPAQPGSEKTRTIIEWGLPRCHSKELKRLVGGYLSHPAELKAELEKEEVNFWERKKAAAHANPPPLGQREKSPQVQR